MYRCRIARSPNVSKYRARIGLGASMIVEPTMSVRSRGQKE